MACWSAWFALSEASWMPCVARASTSLICLLLAEVSSSSSFTRSRMGSVWRCTYFLRAKGLTRPQKPSRDGAARGALPVALPVSLDVDCCVAAGWLWSDEVVCARAGIARTAAKGRAVTRRWFILTFSKLGERLAPLRHAGACSKFNRVPESKKDPADSLGRAGR